jgi:hypothetical protein
MEEEAKLREEERKKIIKEMVKQQYVIPIDDPVDVAKRMRRKKHKLPSLNRDKPKESKKNKREDDQIRKDGIYYIRDGEAKRVYMPKFQDFRLSREPREPRVKEKEPSPKGAKRHINVASTNPLAGGSPKKRKIKKKQSTVRSPKVAKILKNPHQD